MRGRYVADGLPYIWNLKVQKIPFFFTGKFKHDWNHPKQHVNDCWPINYKKININLKRIGNYINYHVLGNPEIGTFENCFWKLTILPNCFSRAFLREQNPKFFRLRRAVPVSINLSLSLTLLALLYWWLLTNTVCYN